MFVYMVVCVYIWLYTCIYICIFVYVVCVSIYDCVFVYMVVCLYIWLYVHIYGYIWPISKHELITKHLKAFLKFTNSIDFDKL